MSQQIDTRSETLVLCGNCKGTGVVTVIHPEPADSREVIEKMFVNSIFRAGMTFPTKEIICRHCDGHRVLKRIKSTTYERVSAPEPTPTP